MLERIYYVYKMTRKAKKRGNKMSKNKREK